jgi:hypothetical protein
MEDRIYEMCFINGKKKSTHNSGRREYLEYLDLHARIILNSILKRFLMDFLPENKNQLRSLETTF